MNAAAPAPSCVALSGLHRGESPQPGRVRLPAGVDPAVLVEALVRGGVRVRALAPRRRSLEDFYMGLLGTTAVAPD